MTQAPISTDLQECKIIFINFENEYNYPNSSGSYLINIPGYGKKTRVIIICKPDGRPADNLSWFSIQYENKLIVVGSPNHFILAAFQKNDYYTCKLIRTLFHQQLFTVHKQCQLSPIIIGHNDYIPIKGVTVHWQNDRLFTISEIQSSPNAVMCQFVVPYGGPVENTKKTKHKWTYLPKDTFHILPSCAVAIKIQTCFQEDDWIEIEYEGGSNGTYTITYDIIKFMSEVYNDNATPYVTFNLKEKGYVSVRSNFSIHYKIVENKITGPDIISFEVEGKNNILVASSDITAIYSNISSDAFTLGGIQMSSTEVKDTKYFKSIPNDGTYNPLQLVAGKPILKHFNHTDVTNRLIFIVYNL